MNAKIYIGALSGLFLLLTSCGDTAATNENNKGEATDSTAYETPELATTCDCQPDWFSTTGVTAPEEGPNSPFAASSTVNCLFHQWSWQKFLYLTQQEQGQNLPYFLNNMTQVTSEMLAVDQPNNQIVLTEHTQAGGNGILATNPTYGDGTSYVVYYSIHVNTVFEKAAVDFAQMIQNQPDTANNRMAFPTGALELKASWVNVNAIAANAQSDYYTTTATIDNKTVTVALLGMHVVGVVENHPEFIWATFEHEQLAAYYDWESTTNQDVPVKSATNLLLFNQTSTAGITDITWDSKRTSPLSPNNVFSLFKYGTPRKAGGNFMMGSSQNTPADNFNNIAELNKSVRDTINSGNTKVNSVWGNYFYDGSLWMNMDGKTHDEQISLILDNASTFGSPDSLG